MKSVTDDTSDEGICQGASNTSSRSPSLPRSEIDTREYDLVSWSMLGWDGACSFAGWGGAFDRSQSDGFTERQLRLGDIQDFRP